VKHDLQVVAGVAELPTTSVPIDELRDGECLRAGGVNQAHVKLLMEYDGELPPILVQRSTMRVIDGMHRLHAARAKGATMIKVQFVDVNESTAFLYGVAANIAHGLPLSLSDRKAAARRLMLMFPEWSDRALGRACGLAGKTVATLRANGVDGESRTPSHRIGLDGRSRPVDTTVARGLARKMLEARPDAPLREIAKAAGLSPGTVRRVRERMNRPTSEDQNDPPLRSVPRPVPAQTQPDPDQILDNLRRDPSIRYRDKGRDLLRLLHRQPVLTVAPEIIDDIPPHCIPSIVCLTRIYAQEWLTLAGMLESRYRKNVA
jgi:ParB-like chromosome segregation protein Spo0J